MIPALIWTACAAIPALIAGFIAGWWRGWDDCERWHQEDDL